MSEKLLIPGKTKLNRNRFLAQDMICCIHFGAFQGANSIYDHAREEMLHYTMVTPTLTVTGVGDNADDQGSILTNCPVPAVGTFAVRVEPLPGLSWGAGGSDGYPVGHDLGSGVGLRIASTGRAYWYMEGATALEWRESDFTDLFSGKYIIISWDASDCIGYADYLEPGTYADSPQGVNTYDSKFTLCGRGDTQELGGGIVREFYAWDKVLTPNEMGDILGGVNKLFSEDTMARFGFSFPPAAGEHHVAADLLASSSTSDVTLALEPGNHVVATITNGTKTSTAGCLKGLVIQTESNRTTGVSPAGFVLDASGTTSVNTNKPYHHLAYAWKVGSTYYYGPTIAFVLETPGTHGVTLYVMDTDGSVSSEALTDLTVTDPDTVYAGTDTVVVSDITGNGGTHPAVVSGQTEVDSADLDAVITTYSAAGKRILFRRGDTFTASTGTSIGYSGVTLGACGTGTGADAQGVFSNEPILNVASGGVMPDSDCIYNHLCFDGEGIHDTGLHDKFTLYKCNLKNADDNINFTSSPAAPHTGCVFASNTIEEGGKVDHFSCWMSGSLMAFIDNDLESTLATGEHDLRCGWLLQSAIQRNSFQSPRELSKHTIKIHGPGYLEDPDEGEYTQYVCVSGNTITPTTNADWVCTCGPGSDSGSERPYTWVADIIWENNTFVINSGIDPSILIRSAGYNGTIRNNVCWCYNTLPLVSRVSRRGVEPTPYGWEIYNNSVGLVVSTAVAAPEVFHVDNQDKGTVQVINNAAFVEDVKSIDMVGGTSSLFTESNNIEGTTDPGFNDLPNKDFTAASGSANIVGAGTDVDNHLAFGGVERDSSSPDIGAYEYGGAVWTPGTAPVAGPKHGPGIEGLRLVDGLLMIK